MFGKAGGKIIITIRIEIPAAVLLAAVLILKPTGSPAGEPANTEQVLALLADMEQAWSSVVDYSTEVEKIERKVDGRMGEQTILMKFRRPNQYYLKVTAGPQEGAEIIYPKDEDELVAIAHAGGFKGRFSRLLKRTVILGSLVPSEFSLDDPRIVRGQHQTITDTSIGHTIGRIAFNIRTAVNRQEGSFDLVKDCSGDGSCLHRIDVTLPADAGQIHEVQQGESLWSIASRYENAMYVIWYNNPEMKSPTNIRPGQAIFVPRYYAPRGRIWVSPETGLLTKLEIFDAQDRLYERYVYRDLRINLGLTKQDFDANNPAYDF